MIKKYIRVDETLVEVSEEVYKEYYRMERRERYQVERDLLKGTFSYHGLDYEDMTGEELLSNQNLLSIEEQIEIKYMIEELKMSLRKLDISERKLINEIYYKGKSLRSLSKEWNAPLIRIYRQHERILTKLKEMLN